MGTPKQGKEETKYLGVRWCHNFLDVTGEAKLLGKEDFDKIFRKPNIMGVEAYFKGNKSAEKYFPKEWFRFICETFRFKNNRWIILRSFYIPDAADID